MITDEIREVEAYEEDGEIKYELTDIINDFFSLVVFIDENAWDLVAAGEAD